MLPELSLHVLDIAQNALTAGAGLVEITVTADEASDLLTIGIKDDGCGMSKRDVQAVTDPFYTTRTTRRVGLGIPFFKQAAEQSGGSFCIASEEGKGTEVTATFGLSSIDRMPLGDLASTMHLLITQHEEADFCFRFSVQKACAQKAEETPETAFTADTRRMRELLGDIPFRMPEVSAYILAYLTDNIREISERTQMML